MNAKKCHLIYENFLQITATAKLLQSCPTLCDHIDSSPPGSPIYWILQARTLEWAAISFSDVWNWKVKVKSLSHIRLECANNFPSVGGGGGMGSNKTAAAAAAKLLQSCPTLCDPIDGSPPGSSFHGIFQARVLEWGTIAFSANKTR